MTYRIVTIAEMAEELGLGDYYTWDTAHDPDAAWLAGAMRQWCPGDTGRPLVYCDRREDFVGRA